MKNYGHMDVPNARAQCDEPYVRLIEFYMAEKLGMTKFHGAKAEWSVDELIQPTAEKLLKLMRQLYTPLLDRKYWEKTEELLDASGTSVEAGLFMTSNYIHSKIGPERMTCKNQPLKTAPKAVLHEKW